MPGPIKQSFHNLLSSFKHASTSKKGNPAGNTSQGRSVQSFQTQPQIKVSTYRSHPQQTSLHSRATTIAPPRTYLQPQYHSPQTRFDVLHQHNVKIADVKERAGDLKHVEQTLTRTLTHRGFSARDSANIVKTLLNDKSLTSLQQLNRIANMLSSGATLTRSGLPEDASSQSRYGTLMHSNVQISALKQHPQDLLLVNTGLQSLLLGKGFSANDAKETLTNLLMNDRSITSLRQLDSIIRGMPVREAEDASTAGNSEEAQNKRKKALNTLGIPADATREQITKAHRKLILKLHDDKVQNMTTEQMKQVLDLSMSDTRGDEQLKALLHQKFLDVQKAYETLTK